MLSYRVTKDALGGPVNAVDKDLRGPKVRYCISSCHHDTADEDLSKFCFCVSGDQGESRSRPGLPGDRGPPGAPGPQGEVLAPEPL